LAQFNARVTATTGEDALLLALNVPVEFTSRIDRVDFQGWYNGFDENGNRRETDWHGFTHSRIPGAFVDSITNAAFETRWDTSMLPSQKNVAVRAFVRFKDAPGLVYVSAATTALTIPDRSSANVALYTSPDLPPSFWSRAGQKKTCSIVLDIEPSRIERAELYAVTWTGGAGQVKEYFKLNGRHFPVAEGSQHVPQFSRLAVEPSILKKGPNTIELLSDTEHHGIEIVYPGPALMARYHR